MNLPLSCPDITDTERQAVLELGLRERRIRLALEGYRRGEGSLAYAAQQAGIALREMVPLAYAHGLLPRADDAHAAGDLGLDGAARL